MQLDKAFNRGWTPRNTEEEEASFENTNANGEALLSPVRSLGVQVFTQELPDFGTGFEGERGIDAIKQVAAGSVCVNTIGELAVRGLQGAEQALDFVDGDVLIIGASVD